MNTTKEESIKKAAYLLEGMTCSGCERTVRMTISKLEGVKSAKADLSSASVVLEYDPEKVTIDKIKSAVNNLGYKFVGELPPNGQRTGSDEAIA